MIIAFTGLFHAIFEEEGVPYVSLDGEGKPRRTPSGQAWLWGLGECINHYFGGKQSPIRENLRLFIQLRDEVEHRYAPAFDMAIAEHCQAMLLNYERLITETFSPFYALGTSVAVQLQLSHVPSKARADALRELQRPDFLALSQLVERFAGSLPGEVTSDPEFRFRVLLVQVPANHAESADGTMRFCATKIYPTTFAMSFYRR
jgi:hypothetical protein